MYYLSDRINIKILSFYKRKVPFIVLYMQPLLLCKLNLTFSSNVN